MGKKEDIVNELHHQVRKNFPRRHVIVKGIDDLWQGDLIEMIPFAKQNKNYKYLLTVIDAFSKIVFVQPVLKKTGLMVTKAMDKILKRSQRIPKNFQTDHGKEFYNSSFNRLMKSHRINHYSTYSALKASIVERFNRTLKQKLFKTFSMQGSYKWLSKIQGLTKEYNKTTHRTIKMAPDEVNDKNEGYLLKTVFQPQNRSFLAKNKFSVDDYVRISKYKHIFEKSFTPNYSNEIFRVTHVNNKYPVTYLLKDHENTPIAGRFYEFELIKVQHPNIYLVEKIIKRKGGQALVKWLGFDSKFNTWLNEKDLI